LLALAREIAPYVATPPRDLAAVLRREACGVVLCQEYEYARLDVCLLLGRVLRIPVVATFQGGRESLGRLQAGVRGLALRACAGLVIGPHAEAERVAARYHVPRARIARVFNPVDAATWRHDPDPAGRQRLGIPEQAVVVVWHGRLAIEPKGLDVLFQAWREVCAQCAAYVPRLLVIGDGIDRARFAELARAAPPESVVWVDRYIDDRAVMRRLLSLGDIYAFPSRHEGFPVAPLEAMACGLPLVAARASGVADILEGGEASGGIVVPVADAPAFAAALRRLVTDSALRQLLGCRARRRVEEHFSYHVVGAQLAQVMVMASARPALRHSASDAQTHSASFVPDVEGPACASRNSP
jgi:glycosyltransferase involved in cell wall biosynthesis